MVGRALSWRTSRLSSRPRACLRVAVAARWSSEASLKSFQACSIAGAAPAITSPQYRGGSDSGSERVSWRILCLPVYLPASERATVPTYATCSLQRPCQSPEAQARQQPSRLNAHPRHGVRPTLGLRPPDRRNRTLSRRRGRQMWRWHRWDGGQRGQHGQRLAGGQVFGPSSDQLLWPGGRTRPWVRSHSINSGSRSGGGESPSASCSHSWPVPVVPGMLCRAPFRHSLCAPPV